MTLLVAAVGLLLAAALSAAMTRHRLDAGWSYVALVGAAGAAGAVPALRVLTGTVLPELQWNAGVAGGPWVAGLDPLSALFVLAILGAGFAGAAFGVAYYAPERGHRAVWRSHATYAMVLAAMVVLVLARSLALFLASWELMAIGSYLLIVTEHEHRAVRRAGLLYLVATHAGLLALIAMFAVWAGPSRDWSFAALVAQRPALAAGTSSLIFALALFGFGVKAGLVPLHFWLPPAHAAAPSHVSALMSGVVIKMGIYGILRLVTMLGPPPLWWGWTTLGVGAASALLGVLWALVQHDLKRLLAYHSVENIGIILIGIGLGAVASAGGHPGIAALAYGAAALHVVNHALFKSVLFLAAGAVYRATGTRDIDALGGLAGRLPYTWLAFGVGAAAIIGVPPFNGFVSEWLVYQGLFRAGQVPDPLRLAVFATPVLALVGGLALACFAKVAGVVFLGKPRTREAATAEEVGPGMRWPGLTLAAVCVAIGVAPALVIRPVLLVGMSIAGLPPATPPASFAAIVADTGKISLLAAGLLAIGTAIWFTRRRAAAGGVRIEETWSCGYPGVTPRMQYTASSFAAPLVAVFGGLAGVDEQREPGRFESTPRDLVLTSFVAPVWARIQRAALRLRPMQQGRLQVYLMYVVATVIALLVYLALAARP